MRKVELYFRGSGVCNVFQPKVYLYDCHYNILEQGKTKSGYISFCLKKGYYYFRAFLNDYKIAGVITVNKERNKYVFAFPWAIYKTDNRTITFLLMDEVYHLPIERGEIILWQK